MLYYSSYGIGLIICAFPTMALLIFKPESIRWFNFLFVVPSLLFSTVVIFMWTRYSWGFHMLKITGIQSYAYLFAIKDRIFNSTQGWIPTGNGKVPAPKKGKIDRFNQARYFWYVFML